MNVAALPIVSELPPEVKTVIRKATWKERLFWAGIIWSFIYTAVSLFAVVTLNNKLQDSCASRTTARVAIRTALASDPDWTAAQQALLDKNLKATVPC